MASSSNDFRDKKKNFVEDQLLLVLEDWREYRTQFHIATRDYVRNNYGRNSLTSWGLSESAVCRLPCESGNAVDGIGEVTQSLEKNSFTKLPTLGTYWR